MGVSMARAQAERAGNMEDGEDGMYIVAVMLPFNFVCTFVLYTGTTNQQCRLNDPVHLVGLAIITNSYVIQLCCLQMPASVPVKLSINVLAAQHKSFLGNPGCSLVLMIATL